MLMDGSDAIDGGEQALYAQAKADQAGVAFRE
jgi:hypothetical protein